MSKASTQTVERAFYFVGERLWVDFVNTEAVERGVRVDLVRTFDDLVRWCAGAGVVDANQAKRIVTRWKGDRNAERTVRDALELRSTLRDMCERLAAGRPNLPQTTLDAINAVLGLRAGALEIVRTSKGYDTRLQQQFAAPADLLVPIAESAADFLAHDDLSLLRKCQNPECILFFYDTTRNHRRRWCSMTACGNRAKVAAHYRRTHEP